MAKYLTIAAVLTLAAFSLAGCSQHSAYVNPDEADKLGGTGIDSQEVRTMAQEMSRDLLCSPAIAGAAHKPVIALLPTRNETRFRVDTDIITYQMRSNLIELAGDKATFVARERLDDVNAERAAKRAGTVTSAGSKPLSGADYLLTATIKSISKSTDDGVSDYVYYSFELIDAESSNIMWAKGYDVKKVGERGVLYR